MIKRKDVIVIISLSLFFIFIVVLLETGNLVNIESSAYYEIVEHMNPIFTFIVKMVTNIGGPVIILSICVVLLSLSATRKKYGIPVTITVLISFLLNLVLKNIFARPRPDVLRLITETSFSFPSGHSMINAALYTILILLILKNSSFKIKKVIISIVLLMLFVLIGISRIYLGVHYLGDVIAGWTLGVLVAFIVYLVYKNNYLETNNNKNKS